MYSRIFDLHSPDAKSGAEAISVEQELQEQRNCDTTKTSACLWPMSALLDIVYETAKQQKRFLTLTHIMPKAKPFLFTNHSSTNLIAGL
jgi:hypothetical protein